MKTCNDIQAALRDRFDTGEDLFGLRDRHFESCQGCREYRAELAQLASDLGAFEVEPPREDLSAAVVQYVHAQSRNQSLRVGDYAAIALAAGGASAAAGWYWPSLFAAESWWSQASNWLAHMSASYAVTGVLDRVALWQDSLNNALANVPSVSQPMLWTSLAICCTGAVAFNAFMAMRFRTAGD